MSRIFILGATGFIGRHLVSSIPSCYEVVTIGRQNCNILFDLEKDLPEKLVVEVNKGDFFIFLSAISFPDACEKQFDLSYRVNVTNTLEVISALTKKGVRVIFSSSDVVFGNNKKPATDCSKLSPFGVYGEMKAEVELSLATNSNVKVARFSYVLGQGDKFTQMLEDSSEKGLSVDVFEGFERNVVALPDVLAGIKSIIQNWDKFDFQAINFSGPNIICRSKVVDILKKYVIIDLKYKTSKAPKSFWLSRAKTIETYSNNFELLLGRKPLTVEEFVKNWG